MPDDRRPAHLLAGHVMTTHVVTVMPGDTFRDIVGTLRRHRVSAVPVLDAEGRVVGVVSEADLLLKEANAQLVRDPFAPALAPDEAAKVAALTAGDLMSSPAITVAFDTPLPEVARAMRRYGVNRFPVVDDLGKLVGIVSRHDVLRVFDRDDDEIRRALLDMVASDPAAVERLSVDVEQGVVRLTGSVASADAATRLAELAGAIDGVIGVESALVPDGAAAEVPVA